MDIEKIVEKVVHEVISKLEDSQNIEKDNEILFAQEKRDDLIVKYDNFIEDWKGIDFIKDGCIVENYKIIIVPELTLNNLIDVSFGRETDRTSSLIVKSFLNGLNILVLEEGLKYRKYKDKSNKKFYRYIETIEKRLEGFGIEFISILDLKSKLKSYRTSSYKDFKNGKTLVSKEDVLRVIESGENKIFINNNTIITSLAKDYIEANEIKIIATS